MLGGQAHVYRWIRLIGLHAVVCAIAGSAMGSVVQLQAPSSALGSAELAGRLSGTYQLPVSGSVEIEAPSGSGAGPVTIRNIQVSFSSFLAEVPVASLIQVQCLNPSFQGASGAGIVLSGTGSPGMPTFFSATGVTGQASGTASFTAVTTSCQLLTNSGGVCSGTFDVSQTSTVVSILNGEISPGPGPRDVRMDVVIRAPMSATNPNIGYVNLVALVRGVLAANTCSADFDGQSGLTIQDVFVYLNAWFAGDPRADQNSDGLSVQDIFNFLNAWFAGCG